MKRILLLIIAFFANALVSSSIQAYPNFITYGYQSCMSCHYNPHGNGPLTDYGRALGAAEISSQYFLGEDVDEEELADSSGFWGKPYENSWLRPSISYRGLYLARDAGKKTQEDDWINMNANISVVGKFLKRDKLIIAMEFGYAPKPRTRASEDDIEEYRSREHYVGYKFSKNWGVYAGLMDKVFGIRVPDHIAYSRSITGLNQNDQTHGLVVHYSNPDFEIGVQPFIGNLVQDESLRQKGVTTMFELTGSDRFRYGASFLSSSSEFVDTLMYSAHSRLGFAKASSLLFELGEVERSQSDQNTKSRYLFTQTHLDITQGLWALTTIETLQANIDNEAYSLRIGPGVQYFPIPKLELRSDIYWTQRVSEESPTTTQLDVTAQVHVWL